MAPPMARTLTKVLRSSATTYSDRTAKNLPCSAIISAAPFTSGGQLKKCIRFTEEAEDSCSFKPSQSDKSSSYTPLHLAVQSIRIHNNDAECEVTRRINSLLCGDIDDSPASDGHLLDVRYLPTTYQCTSSYRKENTRLRKKKWAFNSSHDNRFRMLLKLCTHKLGTNTTLDVLHLLGRDTGVRKCNIMIESFIETARYTYDKNVAMEEFHKVYTVFEFMREHDFQIGEETYGPFLMFIIDMGMVEEFHLFRDYIKKENPKSLSRLVYYEMLLWMKVGDGESIRMLLNNASNFNESYLAVLCERDRQKEVSMLLEAIDIKKVSLKENKEKIFKSLGRLKLESLAKKFILDLKTIDDEGKELSNLIYSYATSIPNIPIKDIVVNFKNLQDELKVASSSVSYEKLIEACCESYKVHLAIDLIDSMFEDGLTMRINMFNSLLTACYASRNYNLVHRIKSMIDDHDIEPNGDTYRRMISLCMKMKDFDGAYDIIKDMERLNKTPLNMYNVIKDQSLL